MNKAFVALFLLSFNVFALANDRNNHLIKDGKTEKLIINVDLLSFAGNKKIGIVEVIESKYGLVFAPHLKGLTAGLHGFHIHENPSCEPKEIDGKLVLGLGAGSHLDPYNTKKHGTPWNDDSHLGELPALYVGQNGEANQPVLAPRLKSLSDIKQRSIIIHEGGDNYSDYPKSLGGGGARMACGVIN